MMSAYYKPLAAADLPHLSELIQKLPGRGESAEFYWPPFQMQNEIAVAQTLGFWRDGRLLAFACWRLAGDEGQITALGTHPETQRQGLMRLLLEQVFNSEQHKIWILEVHEKNLAAQELYRQIGFKLIGRRKKYYRDGAEALVLRLDRN